MLTLNAFSFKNEFYHQTGVGPHYAYLFVGYVEEQIGQQYTGTVPQLHKRYVDDVVGIACCNRVELEYIAFVSNFHPALQFTHTISETKLPFLDINLRVSGDRIRTTIHCQATETHSYLHYDSSHPRHCKESLPYSQLLRLRRICSDQVDFLNKAQEMAKRETTDNRSNLKRRWIFAADSSTYISCHFVTYVNTFILKLP